MKKFSDKFYKRFEMTEKDALATIPALANKLFMKLSWNVHDQTALKLELPSRAIVVRRRISSDGKELTLDEMKLLKCVVEYESNGGMLTFFDDENRPLDDEGRPILDDEDRPILDDEDQL